MEVMGVTKEDEIELCKENERSVSDLMTQAHEPAFPQSTSGSWYPKDYVVGVIDDLQEARQALQAFQASGYSAEEVRLMESGEAVQKAQQIENDKNLLQRFLSSFQDTTDETGAHIYQLAAEKGRHILYVHAETGERVDEIARLMRKYHAHTIKYFSAWSVADVPPAATS